MTEDSDKEKKAKYADFGRKYGPNEDENGYLSVENKTPYDQKLSWHILNLLSQPNMSIDDACWLFSGYRNFSVNQSEFSDPLFIYRIADEKNIPFGSAEYRGALAEHDRIFEIIMSSNHMLAWQSVRGNLTKGEAAWKKARFDTIWIVDLVANHLHDYQKVHIPWLKYAYDCGYLPGTVIRPPRMVDSGKLAILSRSSAELTGVWIESAIEIKFTVNTLQKELDSMRMWVYKKLVELSVKGEKRPTRNELIEIIKEQCPIGHSLISSEQIITYTKDGDNNEYKWSYEAIKQFLLHHTEERKTSPQKRKTSNPNVNQIL